MVDPYVRTLTSLKPYPLLRRNPAAEHFSSCVLCIIYIPRDDFESLGFLLTGGASLEAERAPGVTLAELCPLWSKDG